MADCQEELAGRVATKGMQTALAVRETVMKLLDLIVYISVYFISIVVLVFATDWRLSVPFMIWFAVYVTILYFILPRLKAVSKQQADARSIMTGRIVDSYTNIMTVKLFAHTSREASYAKDGMDGFLQTVHPQMRLVTLLYGCVWYSNTVLVFCVAGLSIYLWTLGIVVGGALAIAVSLAFRRTGMSQWIMWGVSSLFGHLGTSQDESESLSLPVDVTARPK